MTSSFPSPLVSTAWLAEHLGEPDLALLDASWYLPVSGRDAQAEYRAGHIPGAVYFDLDAASATDTPLPHMLPTERDFAALAGRLGVSASSRIVVYDGSGNNLSAGRVWWMFRAFGHAAVAVLDGGLGRWRAEGRPLTPVVVPRESVGFTARLDSDRVRSMAQVTAALQAGVAQVIDVRAAGRFEGRDPEPRAGLSSGHMPGAINLPYSTLVEADGTVLSRAALHQRLLAAGIDPTRPIIATCGSGVSACALLLALDHLELPPPALYDGSWTEWATGGGAIVKQA